MKQFEKLLEPCRQEPFKYVMCSILLLSLYVSMSVPFMSSAVYFYEFFALCCQALPGIFLGRPKKRVIVMGSTTWSSLLCFLFDMPSSSVVGFVFLVGIGRIIWCTMVCGNPRKSCKPLWVFQKTSYPVVRWSAVTRGNSANRSGFSKRRPKRCVPF